MDDIVPMQGGPRRGILFLEPGAGEVMTVGSVRLVEQAPNGMTTFQLTGRSAGRCPQEIVIEFLSHAPDLTSVSPNIRPGERVIVSPRGDGYHNVYTPSSG